MEAVLELLPSWVKWLPTIFMGLVILASIVARFTKTKKDDIAVGKVRSFLLSFLPYLPTIGVNPVTKKMKETLESMDKGT